jgi:hypothetical protein
MTISKGSFFLDRQTARRAVDELLGFIGQAMTRAEVGESGFLHLVVMDPALRHGDVAFEDAILHEHSIGDRALWDADYQAFARAKARLCWASGFDSHAVQALYPYLLREGDTTLWGSANVDGIVVAVSGANPWYDEAFARILGSWLKAAAMARVNEHGHALFLTPPPLVELPAIA